MSAWTVPSYAEGWTVPGYVEERLIGQGASGRVVAAVSEATGRRVAIKYLGPALVRDPTFMWSFRTEAQMLRSLDVPQVVQIYDYVEEPGQGAAIVMELVDGVSLHDMITQRGPTSPESALAVLKGSLLGLAAAHALGIVHRDYKPENVLVDTAGSSKLSDFGVAVKAGKKALAAGTPLYMAPEQWNGAPNSPATDIYAATAVFFECLTAKTPFSGKIGQLRQQHETAAVPLDRIAAPLHALIARGMAKNPVDRPQTAIAFVAELEAVAADAYGADWEERGRSQLAERAAALLPLLLLRGGTVGSSGTSTAVTWLGNGRRRALSVAAIAVIAVLAMGTVATAVMISARDRANLNSSSQVAAVTPTFTAQAAVTPPVSSSQCSTDSTFTYSGTITATAPGSVSYQWLYSSGQPGPVQTVSFTTAGNLHIAGDRVKTKTAGDGWAEIKLVSPAGKTSNKATYKLLCGNSVAGISATATVLLPATSNVTCGTTPPTLTAIGSVTAPKAEKVTYYWALSSGYDSPPATLTFTGASTMAAEPLTITPPGDSSSGEAVLVVTSPVNVASSPATYTLTCTAPVAKVSVVAAVSPASQTVTSCTAAAPTFTFSGTITDTVPGTVSYYWKLPSGDGPVQTLNFSQAGSASTVTTSYKPGSDDVSGSGSIVVTSPNAVSSNVASFSVVCGKTLAITTNGAATATIGVAYSATATVSGGSGTYTWATPTGLPAGLTSTASGATITITGTPTATGTFTIGLSVHDSASPEGSGTASVPVTVSDAALAVTSSAAATATLNTAYSGTATVTGGNGTYTWATPTGLPTGMTSSASGATLTISGTPTAAGTFTVGLSVSDTESPAKTTTASITITVSAPALSLAGGTLGTGTVGTAYTATVTATGGAGTFTYSATGLPGGLAINSLTGTISGTPTASGSFTVTVTVTDTSSQTASGAYTMTVNPAAVSSSPPTASKSPTPTTPVIQVLEEL